MSPANKIAAGMLGVMGILGVGAVIIAGKSESTQVRAYFDNGLDRAVKVELDGKPLASVPAHSATVCESLPVGKHQLRIVDDQGKSVDEGPLEVPVTTGMALHRWAYNIGRTNHYQVNFLMAGKGEPDKPHPVGDDQHPWFELPHNACFLPAETAPEKGRAGTQLAVVGHQPPHPADYPCCANLRKLLK